MSPSTDISSQWSLASEGSISVTRYNGFWMSVLSKYLLYFILIFFLVTVDVPIAEHEEINPTSEWNYCDGVKVKPSLFLLKLTLSSFSCFGQYFYHAYLLTSRPGFLWLCTFLSWKLFFLCHMQDKRFQRGATLCWPGLLCCLYGLNIK